MSESLKRIKKFKKKILRELYDQCTEGQQDLFNRMYGSIQVIPEEKVELAILQCERTIKKNRNRSSKEKREELNDLLKPDSKIWPVIFTVSITETSNVPGERIFQTERLKIESIESQVTLKIFESQLKKAIHENFVKTIDHNDSENIRARALEKDFSCTIWIDLPLRKKNRKEKDYEPYKNRYFFVKKIENEAELKEAIQFFEQKIN